MPIKNYKLFLNAPNIKPMIEGCTKNLVTCVEVLHLLSNHTPRFLTHKAGSMSYSPKVIQHAVLIYCLLSCSSGITFWSSFIMNASFNIQFLKLPMHLFKTLMGVFLSLWSAESSFTLATELKYIHKKKLPLSTW